MKNTVDTLLKDSGDNEWGRRIREFQDNLKDRSIDTKDFQKTTT